MISKVFLALASSCLLSVALGAPQFIHGITPVASAPILSQYHSQDELGQYSYGYSGGPSAKQEVKTADGVVQGGYSYIDSYGLPQSVSYVSDPVGGFRAVGTNFPVQTPEFVAHPAVPGAAVPIAEAVAPADTVEVAAAKAHHYAEKAAAVAHLGRRRRSLAYAYAAATPIHAYAPAAYAPAAYAAPAISHHTYAPAPIVAAAPVAPVVPYAAPLAAAPAVAPVAAATSSQYHSQDELGQYTYGYANQNSAKEEVKTADGITRGSYSYVDSYGLPQSVSYISDPVHGFRAAGTNIPVAPHAY